MPSAFLLSAYGVTGGADCSLHRGSPLGTPPRKAAPERGGGREAVGGVATLAAHFRQIQNSTGRLWATPHPPIGGSAYAPEPLCRCATSPRSAGSHPSRGAFLCVRGPIWNRSLRHLRSPTRRGGFYIRPGDCRMCRPIWKHFRNSCKIFCPPLTFAGGTLQ